MCMGRSWGDGEPSPSRWNRWFSMSFDPFSITKIVLESPWHILSIVPSTFLSLYRECWKSVHTSPHTLAFWRGCAISTSFGVIDRAARKLDLYIIRVGAAHNSSHSKEHPICDCWFVLRNEFWMIRKAVSICRTKDFNWQRGRKRYGTGVLEFSFCIRFHSCSVVLQWTKFTSRCALVPLIWMDKSSLYEIHDV